MTISENRAKLIAKIQKLMALGKGNSEEAMSAMAMAHKLMLENEIAEADVKNAGDPVEDLGYSMVEHNGSPFSRKIFNACCRLNMCGYARMSMGYNNKVQHIAYGKPVRREIALDMGKWVAKAALSEAIRNKKKNPDLPRPYVTDFVTGVADEVTRRVMAIIAEQRAGTLTDTDGNTLPMVIQYDNEMNAVTQYMETQDLKTAKVKQREVQASSYFAGREFGSKINLGAQLTGSKEQHTAIGSN